MSPDARLIAAAILAKGIIGENHDPLKLKSASAETVALLVGKLVSALPKEESQPGIRGMVPVAYLKDILEGIVARLSIADRMTGYDTALDYAKRRLADVEAL